MPCCAALVRLEEFLPPDPTGQRRADWKCPLDGHRHKPLCHVAILYTTDSRFSTWHPLRHRLFTLLTLFVGFFSFKGSP